MENRPSIQKSKLAQREEDILAFWRRNDTFKKTLEKPAPKGDFVFYDGPPFANGLPHYGHILVGTMKDVILRFKAMQGYHVPRRWGWDCHGLPVENEVEKELDLKTKKDIENFGIGKFNAKAKETVMRYADDWRHIIPRTGRWVDMDNDYRTMDSAYTETVWWVFKSLYDKNLVYQGFKSMHLCPRCETTLSNFEVTQGYRELTDVSVYVTFKLISEANTFFVAWTTTPWTLPGNSALAVHPEHDYAFVEITASNSKEILTGDTFIIGAKEEVLRRVFGAESFSFDPVARVGNFMWKGTEVAFSVKRGLKGRELIGQSYEPPFDYYQKDERLPNRSKGFQVYGADFVTEEDGTGIVHIAPAFGEDDYDLAVKEKLPFIQHVAQNGTFRPEVAAFAGLSVKPKENPTETDEKIADYLGMKKRLLKRVPYTHEYPHCWRCDTPLLNYAAPSWFVKVTDLRNKLVEENKKITWVPKEIGEYRFGNWLADAKDWAISRARFWGAPIPVWGCERCKTYKVIGSIDELRRGSEERITKLVLLRHGEGVQNVNHIFDDLPNAFPLTHQGRKEAKEAAKQIKAQGGVDVIVSSPIRRAKETADIVGDYLKTPIIVDERLREVDSGEWDEKKISDPSVHVSREAYMALPLEEQYRAKRGASGESFEEVERRMSDAFSDILAKHKGERVLLVSHESPIVYLLRSLDSFTLEEASRYFKKERFERFARPMTVYVDSASRKEINLHRPHIDDIALTCETCAKESGSGRGLMHRVSEVFDCWFESGAMPYGQAHYPFEQGAAGPNEEPFDPVGGWWKKTHGFPADFIAESLDQTRGWFYSLLVLGVGLFGRSPYKTVLVNGLILAEDGAKMSKRRKNYPDPLYIIEQYGVDSLRYYLLSSPLVRGEELRFSERGIDEVVKKVFNRLDNVLAFYLLYASSLNAKRSTLNASHVLDKWILARLHQLIKDVTEALEAYELDKATRPLGDFVDDLSTWYLRRSRERIKQLTTDNRQPATEKDAEEALATLRHVLLELSKITAPFAPFFAEHLYKSVEGEKESVHLEIWPHEGQADSDVISGMSFVRSVASLALMQRAEHKIKIRQPLQRLSIKHTGKEPAKHWNELVEVLKDEINVKEVVLDKGMDQNDPPVKLETAMTPELKEEGMFRELVRYVQDMRKKNGFKAGESATLLVAAEGPSRRFIEQRERELSHIASLRNIVIQDAVEGAELFQAEELSLRLFLTRV